MNSRPFIHEDFLLDTPAARELYHRHAADLPIIDYHCHLPPKEIADSIRWDNIATLGLGGDHYKWRAMRTAGVSERFCTGDAPHWEKFEQYAATMPKLLRNPLYHWSHIELARYFGIGDRLLNPETARGIYDHCNTLLAQPDFSCRGLMKKSKVEVVCTTDDPVDSLEHHAAIAADASFDIQVRPTWRPDKALIIDQSAAFAAWLEALENASGICISTLSDLMQALQNRHDFFASRGCRLSDRGVDTIWAEDCTESEAASIFAKARAGGSVTPDEAVRYKSYLLHELAVMDEAKGWTMQLLLGPVRNNNSRLARQIGADVGCDSIGDWPQAETLSRFLDRLETEDHLPKTVLYNVNPAANYVFGTMAGNYADGTTPGKVQFGSGWWFVDQKEGMEWQINALSNLGLLSRFIGMLTDSRSFMSFPRHEYFRRTLCNLLGNDMEAGLIPNDEVLVGQMVKNICYANAKAYLGLARS